MRLVILESPFAGDVQRNIRYARACVRDSLLRGEAPIASHLLYTQEGILRDDMPAERTHGINAGLAWGRVAEASVFYTDLGISSGMKLGMFRATAEGRVCEQRQIGEDWDKKMSFNDGDGVLPHPLHRVVLGPLRVIIEGKQGTGKSTMTKLMEKYMVDHGLSVTVVDGPWINHGRQSERDAVDEILRRPPQIMLITKEIL